jgi:sterol desaturase/sphingolipid hydroxylase (fatty acid hydroxylase superfamily)
VVIIYEIIFEGEVLFHHINLKIPLRLEKILNLLIVTPRMHGIHYSVVKDETDSNYSSILSTWDRLHKTARLQFTNWEILIGVPSYSDQQELSVAYLPKLPFTKIRDWASPVNKT